MFSFSKPSDLSAQPASDDIKRRAKIVIDNISDGITFIDANGIIHLFNPAAEQLLAWSEAETLQLNYKTIFRFVNSASQPISDAENPITRTLSSNKPQASDSFYLLTHSEKKVSVSIKVTPITTQDGDMTINDGAIVVFRDITRERAEQNAQTDFISTASHEMRTPVAIIEGYLGMILNPETATIDNRARMYAQKAHDSVKRLGRLFQDLLDVTKADDHRIDNNPCLLDAKLVAKQVVQDFVGKAATKGLTLQFNDTETGSSHGERVLAPPAIICADLDQLNEILDNIIENAIKYTKQGGVKVSVDVDSNRVRFTVTDTGIGIPEEDVPHLFQKFYRVDNSQTREIGGTGLGLYLIKRLADNIGGTIGVKSVYGQGSTFWLELDNLTREQAIQKAREIQARQAARRGA